jgi:hypothetical protein
VGGLFSSKRGARSAFAVIRTAGKNEAVRNKNGNRDIFFFGQAGKNGIEVLLPWSLKKSGQTVFI